MTSSSGLLRTLVGIGATISDMRHVSTQSAALRDVSSDGGALRMNAAPLLMAAWWGTVIILNAVALRGFPAPLSVSVIAVAATAGAILAVLMTRAGPHRETIRLIAYLCTFLATQAAGVSLGIIALLPGITLEPSALGWTAIAFAVADAGLSLWTFALVRSWLSRGHGSATVRANRSRGDRLMVGCAATGAALGAFFVANVIYGQLTAILLVPQQSFPLAPGGVEQWLIVTIVLGLAGVVEEPVFVGVAVLLWRRLDRRNIVTAAAVSILARASIHLYYAGGTANASVTAVGLVILWCAIWSGFNLFLVYRTHRLWPVMLAHGLQNAFVATAGPWTLTDTPQDRVAVAGVLLLLFGTLSFITAGGLAFVTTRLLRRWRTRLVDVRRAPAELTLHPTSTRPGTSNSHRYERDSADDDDSAGPTLLCW